MLSRMLLVLSFLYGLLQRHVEVELWLRYCRVLALPLPLPLPFDRLNILHFILRVVCMLWRSVGLGLPCNVSHVMNAARSFFFWHFRDILVVSEERVGICAISSETNLGV